MPRDYHAEYEARNSLARERGFSGYGQERHAIERFQSDDYAQDMRAMLDINSWRDDPGILKDYFDAFVGPDSDDRSRYGGRAHWFVEVTGQVESYDEWEEKYGGG